MKKFPYAKRVKRLLLLSLYGIAAMIVCALILNWWSFGALWHVFGFKSPQMAAAQYAKQDVIGNLGGMPVSIPRHFADYVEYDDDPASWSGKIRLVTPTRTQQSSLRSFGFYTRYPDMAGLSSPEMYKNKENYRIYDTQWISVGLNTGQNYPGDGSLDRRAKATVETPDKIWLFNYEKLPNKEYGLAVYGLVGLSPHTGKPARQDDNADDIYIYRNSSGHVTTYIVCSNRPHNGAPCSHSFSLEPNVKASIYMSYRRSLLPEWQGIQESVRNLLLSFKTKEITAKQNP